MIFLWFDWMNKYHCCCCSSWCTNEEQWSESNCNDPDQNKGDDRWFQSLSFSFSSLNPHFGLFGSLWAHFSLFSEFGQSKQSMDWWRKESAASSRMKRIISVSPLQNSWEWAPPQPTPTGKSCFDMNAGVTRIQWDQIEEENTHRGHLTHTTYCTLTTLTTDYSVYSHTGDIWLTPLTVLSLL